MSTMEQVCEQMIMSSVTEMEYPGDYMDIVHGTNFPANSECEMTVDCNYSYNYIIQGTITPSVFLKTKTVSALTFIFETQQVVQKISQSSFHPILKNSYSPPPLFLVNESFLI
tara:strand:- start:34 stop:372 length:339 start_codon:yes stop_codon:yes gene_type:complete